jgi:hypothetical protein
LAGSCGNLPQDCYLPDGGTYRYRRYTAFRVSSAAVAVQPHRPYFQPVEVNRVAGGIAREFAPLDPAQQGNPFLHGLLRLNVDQLPGGAAGTWQVDVHLVRVVARPGKAGRPSPEGVHRDGFDYISIHLLGLGGPAAGGASVVVRPDGTPVTQTRLAHRLDSLYLDDRALRHDVTPLVTTGGRAHRDVLLMSFCRTE